MLWLLSLSVRSQCHARRPLTCFISTRSLLPPPRPDAARGGGGRASRPSRPRAQRFVTIQRGEDHPGDSDGAAAAARPPSSPAPAMPLPPAATDWVVEAGGAAATARPPLDAASDALVARTTADLFDAERCGVGGTRRNPEAIGALLEVRIPKIQRRQKHRRATRDGAAPPLPSHREPERRATAATTTTTTSVVVVLVSGGCDSVALLRLLVEISRRRGARVGRDGGLRLEVLHFNHGLRPESADEARRARRGAAPASSSERRGRGVSGRARGVGGGARGREGGREVDPPLPFVPRLDAPTSKPTRLSRHCYALASAVVARSRRRAPRRRWVGAPWS